VLQQALVHGALATGQGSFSDLTKEAAVSWLSCNLAYKLSCNLAYEPHERVTKS
jgi:hypothetical protein